MNHNWGCPESNFQTHQNQQSCYVPYQQCCDNRKYSTRAYVNPHVANYEHIKRSLTKPPLLGSNKIHVNPNFKGNQEQQSFNINNIIYPNHSYSVESSDVTQPGPSKTSSTHDEKVNSSAVDASTKVTISKFRFRKVNEVNPVKTKYSWCKSGNVNDSSKSNGRSFLKSSKNCKKPILGPNKYKFVASKRAKTQTPEKTTPRIYLSKTKIINKSRTKLVNSQRKIVKVYSPVKIPFYNYDIRHKKSNILKVAKAVTNKYKYFNSPKQCRSLKYKIDKRNKVDNYKKENVNRVRDISKLFPNYFHTRLRLSHQTYDGAISKNICLQRKNPPPQQVHRVIPKSFPNKRVVKIGGILYKTTTNKLTLAKNKEQKKQSQSKSSNHVVYVRGEKFLLENNGKTLRRQPQSMTDEKNVKRIDIGGVTYIQKSKNVLVRTNVHQAQYVVNKAKNKSIAILTNLRKRSTMPCMIYHRFGKCNRHHKGLCMYKHDPKNISICKLFLKGDCKNSSCLLSHQAIPEKMATCHFFLNGFCDRDNCPFPHVKLNKNVAICEKFLQGFCNLGKECTKRHLHLCPNFDKFGKCSLGSKCHYPHKVLNKKQTTSENTSKTSENNEKVQYFIHSGIRKSQGKAKKSEVKKESKKGGKKKLKMAEVSWTNADQENETVKCVPKRIKLDKLPCYIPLQKDG